VSEIRFGTDGWRGVIAEDFTYANLRRVADAAARYFRQQDPRGAVLVGYDRRFFSPEFARTVASVLLQRGLNVSVVDSPMTTPSLSVAVVQQKAAWGVMMTASHNPALYNGFKVKDRFGRSAPPEVTRAIEERLEPADVAVTNAEPAPTFAYRRQYETYLKSRLDWAALKRFKGRVVFDFLHGAAAGIPETLLKGIPAQVIGLHTAHDPLFGGLHPEPIETYLEALKKEVRKQRAAVGIALDGDADRLGIVDDLGRYMTPHQVFPLLAYHCVEYKKWRGKIVQSISLGALGERIAKAYSLPFEEVPVGFKHVAERMLKEDVVAGGEESGGYAVRGGLPERDGILSGLLFLEMIAARGKKPAQLINELEKKFGRARFNRIDIALPKPIYDKDTFVKGLSDSLPNRMLGKSVADVRTYDGMKIVLSDGSWVLLRPSGTEPLIRTYAETESWKTTDELLQWAQKTVLGYLKNQKVPA
jgi:phosphomannomutase